ncbi:MAG: hypothetical protein P4L84_11200 [Isosphaeraceae bacterium]|nr:hypothetical protein [Isosphaeraceae bacterium]
MLLTLATLIGIKAAGFTFGFALGLPYIVYRAVDAYRHPFGRLTR